MMGIYTRFITGFMLGFEINPADGIYFHLSLGIFEVLFAHPDAMEETE
jgi:hypothetical protein